MWNFIMSLCLLKLAIAADISGSARNMVLAAPAKNVVVWVETASATEPVTAFMKQLNKEFIPDLLVIPTGSTVYFPNEDPFFHNIFSLNPVRKLDLGKYKGDSKPITFVETGVFPIGCEIHPWMSAHIVVLPDSNFVISDDQGRFTLKDVAEGQQTIYFWSADLKGIQTKVIEVKAERNTLLLTLDSKILKRKRATPKPVETPTDNPAAGYYD